MPQAIDWIAEPVADASLAGQCKVPSHFIGQHRGVGRIRPAHGPVEGPGLIQHGAILRLRLPPRHAPFVIDLVFVALEDKAGPHRRNLWHSADLLYGLNHDAEVLRWNEWVDLTGRGHEHAAGFQCVGCADLALHLCSHLFRCASLHQIDPVDTAGPDHLRPGLLQLHHIHTTVRLQAIETVHMTGLQVRNDALPVAVTMVENLDIVLMPGISQLRHIGIVVIVQKLGREDGTLPGGKVLGYQDHGRELGVCHSADSAEFARHRGLHVLLEHLRIFQLEEGEDLQPHLVEGTAEAGGGVIQNDRVADPGLQVQHGLAIVRPNRIGIKGAAPNGRREMAQPVAGAMFVGERTADMPGGPIVPLHHKPIRCRLPCRPPRRYRRHHQVAGPAYNLADIIEGVVESVDLLACPIGNDARIIAELLEESAAIHRLVIQGRLDAFAPSHAKGHRLVSLTAWKVGLLTHLPQSISSSMSQRAVQNFNEFGDSPGSYFREPRSNAPSPELEGVDIGVAHRDLHFHRSAG